MNLSGQKNGSISAKVSGLNLPSRSASNGPASTKGKAVAFVGSGGNMDSLADRISNLENERFEYDQHNLGLLLIEKKEWASKYDEFKEASVEAADALKSEQASVEASAVTKKECLRC